MKNPALYLCKGSPPGSASSDHQRALQPGPAPSHQSLASGQPKAGGLWVTSCPTQGLGGDFAFQAVACSEKDFLASPGCLGKMQIPNLTQLVPNPGQIGPSPKI